MTLKQTMESWKLQHKMMTLKWTTALIWFKMLPGIPRFEAISIWQFYIVLTNVGLVYRAIYWIHWINCCFSSLGSHWVIVYFFQVVINNYRNLCNPMQCLLEVESHTHKRAVWNTRWEYPGEAIRVWKCTNMARGCKVWGSFRFGGWWANHTVGCRQAQHTLPSTRFLQKSCSTRRKFKEICWHVSNNVHLIRPFGSILFNGHRLSWLVSVNPCLLEQFPLLISWVRCTSCDCLNIYPRRLSYWSYMMKYGSCDCLLMLVRNCVFCLTVTTKHHVERLCAPWFKSKSKFWPCLNLNYAFIDSFSFASAWVNHLVMESVHVDHPTLGCNLPNDTKMFWTHFVFLLNLKSLNPWSPDFLNPWAAEPIHPWSLKSLEALNP